MLQLKASFISYDIPRVSYIRVPAVVSQNALRLIRYVVRFAANTIPNKAIGALECNKKTWWVNSSYDENIKTISVSH